MKKKLTLTFAVGFILGINYGLWLAALTIKSGKLDKVIADVQFKRIMEDLKV